MCLKTAICYELLLRTVHARAFFTTLLLGALEDALDSFSTHALAELPAAVSCRFVILSVVTMVMPINQALLGWETRGGKRERRAKRWTVCLESGAVHGFFYCLHASPGSFNRVLHSFVL